MFFYLFLKYLSCVPFVAFVSREMTLPDTGMVYGRMLVTGWDFGVESVDDQSVNVVMQAVEVAFPRS